jgi:hypothetical protein
MYVAAELPVGHLGPEWKQEIGEAPVNQARAGCAVPGILRAPGRIGDVILWGTNRDLVAQRLFLSQIIGIDVACVQETEMRGVDLTLERL